MTRTAGNIVNECIVLIKSHRIRSENNENIVEIYMIKNDNARFHSINAVTIGHPRPGYTTWIFNFMNPLSQQTSVETQSISFHQ
jgi:hypothetical protein